MMFLSIRLWYRVVITLLLTIFAIGSAALASADGETLEVRNTSPLAQVYGLPAMRGSRSQGSTLRFDVNAANSFTGAVGRSEFVFLDGETSTISYTFKRGMAERWELGLEVPWTVHSGGRFDTLIDEFHDAFGLPDGGRPLAERGAIDYVVRADGQSEVDVRGKTSVLGDVRGWLGYELYKTEDRSLVSRLHLKLPTGSPSKLSGSGGTDVAIGFDFVDHRALSALGAQLSLGLGLARLGDGEILARRQKDFVPYGHLGLVKKVGAAKRLALLGQLDSHGAIYSAELSHLGHSVLQGTLGLQFEFTSKVKIELALIEDLSGAAAADAIFKLAVIGRL